MSISFLQKQFRSNGNKINLSSLIFLPNSVHLKRYVHDFCTRTNIIETKKVQKALSCNWISKRCFFNSPLLKEKGKNDDAAKTSNVDIDIKKNLEKEEDQKNDEKVVIEKENIFHKEENVIEGRGEGKEEREPVESLSDSNSYFHFLIEKCRENSQNEVDVYEDSWYVELIYESLKSTKIIFDCSLMSSIIITTLFMRIIMLPLTISAERDRRKQAILNPLIRDLTEKLKSNAQEGNIKKAIEYKQKILNVRNTHGISLIPKSIIFMAVFQSPLFFLIYFSMKKISSFPHIFKEFTFESPLWLDSLSLPDPYFILPLLSSLLLLSNNELTSLIDKKMNIQKGYLQETEFQKSIKKYTKVGMRILYISLIFFFKSMPSGLFIYFITNTFFQLFVTQLCKVKMVERFLDLPPLLSKGFNVFDKKEDKSLGKRKRVIHMEELLTR